MKNYQAMLKLILSCPPNSEHNPLQRDMSEYFERDYTYWLRDLMGQKLISNYVKRANYNGTGKDLFTVWLTNEGLHYFDKRKEDNRRFWYRSIIVPICVSVATTLLTTGVTWLISLLS